MHRGLLAAAVFLIWFFLVDAVKQQPFFTLAYLSGLLFSFTTALPATARVLVLVGILLLVFGLVGWIVGRYRRSRFLAIPIALLLFGFFYGISAVVFRVNILRALGWIEFLVGCLLAGFSITGVTNKIKGDNGDNGDTEISLV